MNAAFKAELETKTEPPKLSLNPPGAVATLWPPEQRAKVLSSSRIKLALVCFVGGLLSALGVMLVLVVSHIFNWLTPSIHDDLKWKATRSAAELSQTGELGIVLRDEPMLRDAFEPYKDDQDIQAIVATDAEGKILAVHKEPPVAVERLFTGPASSAYWGEDYVASWAPLAVEGKVIGKVAVAVSTARLEAGHSLKRRILILIGLSSLAGLLLSLTFVRGYVGPVIRMTEKAFVSLERAALELARRQRIEREMEIGARIQTCLLPAQVAIPGIEVAARMRPATEVGGDYYDAFPTTGGGWIGIGDVAGHGLSSGLIMLMLQSAVAAVCRREPQARPRDVVSAVNSVLFDNIRKRLGNDEHVTFTLLRYQEDGRICFAGAHEELILLRQGAEKCELVETPGTWLGAMPDISKFTEDSQLTLSEGDLLVLYTDGVTEARGAGSEQFGLERLLSCIESARDSSAQQIVNKVFDAVDSHMLEQEDDLTLMVVRYHCAPSGSRPIL